MANLLGALRLALGADTAAFEQGMGKAQGVLRAFGVNAQRAAAVAAGAFAGIGTALAFGLNRALQNADQLFKLSQQIGISVEALSGLKHAADLSGVSMESLTTSMTRLSRSMAEALSDPRSTPARTLDAIGVSATNAAGQLRPVNDVLADVAERFSRMQDGAGKTTIAMNLFGRSGAALIPLLNQGRDGLAQAREEAERLGIALDTRTAAGAERFNDNMRRLQLVLDGLFTRIAANLVPVLETLSNKLVEVSTSGEQVRALAQTIATVFIQTINVVGQLAIAFKSFGQEVATIAGNLRQGILPFTQAWRDSMAAVTAQTEAARSALRGLINNMQLATEGFVASAGKLGAAAAPAAAPIIQSARAVGDAMRQARDHARAMLDDIVNAPTETFVNKMRAIEQALRDGTIGFRQFGQMVRSVTRENQQHMFSLATATANALTAIFGKNKAAQIASIIILTATAIMQALATLPPPFSWAQAALAAATGAAQLAAVRKTTVNGGGSAPTVSGGGGSGDTQGQTAPAQTLIVQGLSPGQFLSGDVVRDFAQRLLDFQKDGGVVILK
jgi:hypothetical protein